MTRNIDIKTEEQVGRINRLACEAPYEVWLSTDRKSTRLNSSHIH